MKYQMHPDHGKHIAYSPTEEQLNIKNGWKTVTKDEFYAVSEEKKKALANATDTERADLVARYEAEFGEKPHHKLGTDKIRAALDGGSE